MSNKMPVAFITDFGPMPAVEEDDYTQALGRLGKALPRPKAILIMSGHWETDGVLAVTASAKPQTIYDFQGFPAEYYRVAYPAPGAPALAREAAGLLSEAGFPTSQDPDRGLDHGAWAPLSRVYPKADVPIVQLTVPAGEDPEKIMAVGRALSPLREKGVLLVGAGTLSHNLRLVHFGGKNDEPDAWAKDFDAWFRDAFARGDTAALVKYKTSAPSARLAVPTPEHFDPFFYVWGAAEGERVNEFFHGIRYGNGILSSFALGMEAL